MKFIIFIFLTTFFSCDTNRGTEKEIDKPINTETSKQVNFPNDTTKVNASNTEIIETFVDSINIGEKGKCKIELIKHGVYEDTYVTIKFYVKRQKTWNIQNTYSYETNALMGFEPHIADFDNDQFSDVSFVSGTAARGANEIRRLFIYDDKKQELISIVNSQDFPNMRYNKELDCIDAFLVHGSSSTVFARIKGDSLVEFASVHNDNNRTVYEIDVFGKEKLLRKDTNIKRENVYTRYRNYKPLKEYKE